MTIKGGCDLKTNGKKNGGRKGVVENNWNQETSLIEVVQPVQPTKSFTSVGLSRVPGLPAIPSTKSGCSVPTVSSRQGYETFGPLRLH